MSFSDYIYGPGDEDHGNDCYIVYDENSDSFVDLTNNDFYDDAFDDYDD